LPEFLRRYPEIAVSLDLDSRPADLVAESVDIAVRLGPLPSSGLVVVRLGEMRRYICASPAYIKRRGMPKLIEDVNRHDTIEMPGPDGRVRSWILSRENETVKLEVPPRITVKESAFCPAISVRLTSRQNAWYGFSRSGCLRRSKCLSFSQADVNWLLPYGPLRNT
jgi:DNA-binding transcriptional LysR family regulator